LGEEKWVKDEMKEKIKKNQQKKIKNLK